MDLDYYDSNAPWMQEKPFDNENEAKEVLKKSIDERDDDFLTYIYDFWFDSFSFDGYTEIGKAEYENELSEEQREEIEESYISYCMVKTCEMLEQEKNDKDEFFMCIDEDYYRD